MGRRLKQAILILVPVVALTVYVSNDGASMVGAATASRVNLQANLGGAGNANPGSTAPADGLSTQHWQVTTTTQATIDPAILRKLAEVALGDRTSTTPTAQLTSEQYRGLLAVLEAWQATEESVASQLHDAGVFFVSSKEIHQFVLSVCAGNLVGPLADLKRQLGWAGLRALPGINDLLALVASECHVDAPTLDYLSNQLVHNLLDKEELRETRRHLGLDQPPVTVPQSENVNEAYEFACGLIKDPLEDWVAQKLRLDEDGGFLLALGMGALQVVCTPVLRGIVERILGTPPTSSTLPATS